MCSFIIGDRFIIPNVTVGDQKNCKDYVCRIKKHLHNVMSIVMDMNEADVLAGRVKSVSSSITLYMNWIESQMHMLTLGKS